jgi:hypothetical protein
MPECSTLLQILLPFVTFRYTSDSGMWGYGITAIAKEALCCKSRKSLGGIDSYAKSWNKFAPDCHTCYTSDTATFHYHRFSACSAPLQHNFAADATLTEQATLKFI